MTDVAPPVTQGGDSIVPLVIAMVRACVAFCTGLFGPDVPPALGPDTTVIVEPLAADGLPDYAAYARSLLGSGTPPHENAAVPLLAACWPADINKRDLPTVCREIGAPDKPPRFATIDNAWSFDAEMREALTRLVEDRLGHENSSRDSLLDLEDAVAGLPWRGDEVPPLRDWLDERAPAFDLILKASGRPRFYLPQVHLLESNRTNALCSAHGETGALRYASRRLSLRAMRLLGEGRSAEAWRDILAIHKFVRLATGPNHRGNIINHLMAVALSHCACEATLRLLDTPHLPEAEIAAIQRDLASFPPFINRRGCWEMDRLTAVACVIDSATMPRLARAETIQNSSFLLGDDPGISLLFLAGIDWNQVLRSVNRFSDTLRDAYCNLCWSDRRASLRALDNHMRAAIVGESPEQAARRFFKRLFGGNAAATHSPLQDMAANTVNGLRCLIRAANAVAQDRSARSETAGEILIVRLFPAIMEADTSLTRAEAQFALTRVAAALAVWRSGKGRGHYPERLDDLVPGIFAEMPTDPFTGKPFIYERRGDGYVLYSLGPDENDDEGTDYNRAIVKGEWSDDTSHVGETDGTDVVVCLPMPKHPILEKLRTARQRDAAQPEARDGQPTSQPGR